MSLSQCRTRSFGPWSVPVRLPVRRGGVLLSFVGLSVALLAGCGGGGTGAGGGGGQQTGNPVPAIASVSPASVTAGAAAQTLTVTGSSFVNGAVVSFNGTTVATTYASSTTLTATVPAAALSAGESANVTVTNPSPGGGTSGTVTFAVMSPTPKVAGISPTSVPQAHDVTITITGTGFESNSTVEWNGTALPTTFVNSTTLTVSLSADQLQSLGTEQITVNNPGPGGSATVPVAVLVYPVPSITSIAPASAAAGSASLQITLTGTSFVTGSVVFFDQTAIATTYVSATSITAMVPAGLLVNGHNAAVAVQNQTPIVTMSSPMTFAVTAPAPVLTTISPLTVAAGLNGGTIRLTGTGFEPGSVAQWNGAARTTGFYNPTVLLVNLTAADLASAGTGQITVNNPAPGGGTSAAQTLTIAAPPVITAVSPSTLQAESYNSTVSQTITVTGTNFDPKATLLVSGVQETIVSQTTTQIVATIGANQLDFAGVLAVYVVNPEPGNSWLESKQGTLNVISPMAPFSVNPAAAQVGSADLKVALYGGGFFPDSVVEWNGVALATTYSSSGSLTATIPASLLTIPGTATVSVLTPENLGAASATQGFSVFVAMPINDLVWNSHDGLLYATIAGSGGPGLGNSLVGIDPTTGTVQRTIFVGSEPNRLAISDDGTQAFVGLDGAGAVRQVNLTTGTAGVQWTLSAGAQTYSSPPYKASSLAAVPGEPSSVAVYSTSGVVQIFDSGVARANSSTGLNTYFGNNSGGLTFGSSASTLYLSAYTTSNYAYVLTVDSTGITGYKQLATSGGGQTVQYDNSRLYFPNGIVADASTGATVGQFSVTQSYSTTPVQAQGPVVSESALNRAWVLPDNYGSLSQVVAYDETTFNPVTSIAVTGLGMVSTAIGNNNVPADLVRWGQNGLAFHTGGQLYLLHGAIVKDTSSSPADVQVTAQAPATVTTGTAFNITLQVNNAGPNDAQGVMLTASLPGALIFGSATASQGSCTGSGVLYCDLGAIKNGANATVTITAMPSTAGTDQINAAIDSQSYDPNASNNNATATTTASGSLYSRVPAMTSLSPNVVQSGGASFTLTVNGSGFTSASTVEWNGAALPTSLVNSGQLTATVDSSLITNLGWGEVTVATAAPGGGNSAGLPVSVYSLLPVPVNAMVWDPFTRKLYAVLPSTSTSITGNSVVSIDPTTGKTGTPVQVGSEPNLVAETTGGNYLYLGVSGAKTLARFNMATQAVDATVALTSTAVYPTGPVAATSVATMPGLENSVSVGNVGIFDFSGTTATERPTSKLWGATGVRGCRGCVHERIEPIHSGHERRAPGRHRGDAGDGRVYADDRAGQWPGVRAGRRDRGCANNPDDTGGPAAVWHRAVLYGAGRRRGCSLCSRAKELQRRSEYCGHVAAVPGAF